ncbi:MAG: ABC transporter ATP-binding protein [Oscillospiraceae bacterium]|nr:ABC transporter ATP-binding protein [Oscillospiraceae bacterium]
MKRILRYLKPYVGKLLLAAGLLAVSTLCDLLLPTLMSDILEQGVRSRDFDYILLCCGQMLAVAVASLLSLALGTRLSTRIVADFCADLRADIFRKVNTLSFEEFGSMGTAALVTRATHDVETVSWVASMLCSSVATVPLLFIGGTVLALRKDATLSLILLLFIPVIFAGVILIGRKVLPLWDKSDLYIDKQNAIMRERLRGIRVIRAFNAEPREQDRIAEATHVMADNIIKANVSMGLLAPLSSLLLNLAILLIVWFGGQRLSAGTGSAGAGDILAIIQYITLVMNGVITASFAVIMYPHAQVAAGRIGQVFEAKGMGDNSVGRDVRLSGDISFDHVSFSYGGEENAVDDVSLHIRPGQKVAVIGGTGSGKSTLMALMLGFRTPTWGQVCFDGVSTTALSKRSLRAGISSVLQGAAIYTGTIEENIRMGKPEATAEELAEAARIAQLSDFIAGCENGMQHEIKQAGKNLSGGQKQRLSIARAIVKEAPVYIFDDSFSALDFLTEKNLRTALNEKIRGKTQIVVTQRVTSAMSADCIFVMEQGRLADAGTHTELLERCRIYQEIFASQTGGGAK